MTQITSHILDTSLGAPAQGVAISLLQQQADESWNVLGSGETNADGRVSDFMANNVTGNDVEKKHALPAGIYKLSFKLSDYYKKLNTASFYPYAEVVFEISGDGQHYHVPLLLNPFGYSTYRGS